MMYSSMDIHLRPPTEAAGISIGSTRAEARRDCVALGNPSEFRRSDEASTSLVLQRPSGLSIFVYFDHDDFVEAIEFGRPGSGDDVVSYRGINLFNTPADELIERLSADDRTEVSEGGRSVTAPDLLLALWRAVISEGSADEDGRYFESVLVARPGYYD